MNKELLVSMKGILNEIADVLYKGDIVRGTTDMNKVIPSLAEFASSMSEEETREKLLNNILVPLLEAMEGRDATLMADIISYELMPLIESMI